MKKNILGKSLLTAALAMSVIATGANVANAKDSTIITNQSELQQFLTSGTGVGDFEKDIILTSSLTERTISDSMEIFTKDYTLSGNNQYSGYKFGKDAVVNLTGSPSFQYLNSSDYGAAIYNKGTLTFDNASPGFESNKAKYNGGALYNEGTITSLTGDFVNNSSGSYAGAIYNKGTISFLAGDFINNASVYGGAIFNDKNAVITALNGNFANNHTNGFSFGGAIYNGYSTSKIDAIGSDSQKALFYNNSATSNYAVMAGAIYNNGIIDSIQGYFVNNAAKSLSATSTAYGGAIHNSYDGKANIKNSVFMGNYTVGGPDANGGAISNQGTLSIADSMFLNNTISRDAGKTQIANDIYNYSTLNLTGNVFMTGGITDVSTGNYSGTTNIGDGTTITNLILGKGATLNQYKVKFNNSAALPGSLDIRNGAADNIVVGGKLSVPTQHTWAKFKIDIFDKDNYDKITFTSIENDPIIAIVPVIYSDVDDKTELTVVSASAIKTMKATSKAEKKVTSNHVYITSSQSGKITLEIDSSEIPTLAHVITTHTNDEKYLSYAVTKDTDANLNLTSDCGALSGTDRDFTLIGNYSKYNKAFNGNGYKGITVASGQTFSLDDAKMSGFKISASGSETGEGSVIKNSGTIPFIGASNKVIFEGNSTIVPETYILGGAVYNAGTIYSMNADFINNTAKITGNNAFNASGGALYNSGIIASMTGDFSGNSVNVTSGSANGGAIFNNGQIGNIVGNFDKNTATSTAPSPAYTPSYAQGGAIYNNNQIASIKGNFTENAVSSDNYYAEGGAIFNYYSSSRKIIIGEISGNFDKNSVTSGKKSAAGGAIYNDENSVIYSISGNFTNNTVTSKSDASDEAAMGGAILNATGAVINDIKGDFSNNTAVATDKAHAVGAAIYNDGTINNVTGNFTNNKVESNGDAYGGAIFNDGTMLISNSTFSGNTANGKPNDITNTGTIVFVGKNTLEGGINNIDAREEGEEEVELTDTIIIGDGATSTTVTLGKDATIKQTNVIATQNAMLALGTLAVKSFTNSVGTFTANGGTLNLQNASIDALSFNNLVLAGDLNMMVEADLAQLRMDTIDAFAYSGEGKIHVTDIKLLSDATTDSVGMTFVTSKDGLRDKVDYTGKQGIAYSTMYKYDVSYDKKSGMFNFTRGGGGADAYVPAILASSAAVQAGGFITQVNSYDQAFSNMDQLMLMPRKQRTAWKNANKYAVNGEGSGDGIITYSPNQDISGKGVWFRPYASFENVPLNNGPKVDNFNYGGLVGGDSDIISLKHGWDMVWGAYAGYNGSHQKYEGNSIYQNGGMIGVNSVWYKGDFFTGLTLNVGASVADISTMFGKEYMTMLSTGIASKTGYNWELFDSKFIIQPSFLMSYSFINTFDYKNAAGIDMHSDPLNAIQLVPGLKFIGNLPKGWQPYIGVSMIWNLMDKTKFYANDVSLPQMSIDPYVQYGLGVQKRWGDKFTGFGQVMFRNGGRNGIALDAGFKYELGKNGLNTGKKAAVKHYAQRNISLTAK